MKITCPACNASYRLPDEKIQGKNRIFKINCKRCGAEIRVRGVETADEAGRTTLPFALSEAMSTPAAPPQVWFAGLDGKQVGPLTQAEVSDHIMAGRLGPEDLVWRKGFEAWKPVRSVAPFDDLVAGSPATGAAGVHGRAPRRAQTLELSSAMIELLVKLDNQTPEAPVKESVAVPPVLPAEEPPAVPTEEVPPPIAAAEIAPELPPSIPEAADVSAIAPALPPRETTSPTSGLAVARSVSRDNIKIGVAKTETPKVEVAPEPAKKAAEPAKPAAAAPAKPDSGKAAPAKTDAKANKPTPVVPPKAAEPAAKTAAAKPAAAAAKKSGGSGLLVGISVAVVAGVVGIFAVRGGGDSTAPAAPAAEPTPAVATAAAEPTPAPVPPPTAPSPTVVAAPAADAAVASAADVVADAAAAVNVEANAAAEKAAAETKAAEAKAAEAKAADAKDAEKKAADAKAAEKKAADAKAAEVKEAEKKAAEKKAAEAKEAEKKAAAEKAKAEKEKEKEAVSKKKSAEDKKADAKKVAEEKKAAAKAEKAEKAKAEKKAVAEKAAAAKADKAAKADAAKKAAADKADAAKRAAADKAEAAKAAEAAKKGSKPAADDDEIDAILAKRNKGKDAGKPAAPEPEPAKKEEKDGPPLSQGQVDAVAARASQKVIRCYMLYADVDGGEEQIKVQVMVNSDGSVASSKVQGKHASDQVGKCVSEAVKVLQFPQSSGAAKKYTVRYGVGG